MAYPQNYPSKHCDSAICGVHFAVRFNNKVYRYLNIHVLMCVCVLTHDNKNYIIDIVIEKGLPPSCKIQGKPMSNTHRAFAILYRICPAKERTERGMNEIITTTTNTISVVSPMEEIMNGFKEYADVDEITLNSYMVCLRHFFGWMQDNHIRQPKRPDILQYVKYLDSEHPRNPRHNTTDCEMIRFAAGTQARYLRAVKLFFKWTSQNTEPENRMFYYPNVSDGVKGKQVRADNKKRNAFETMDLRKILDSIDRTTMKGKRDYAMILLSATAALRIIELQRANVGNIETIAGEKVLFIQGKGRDEADEYKKLTPEVFECISEYLDTRTHKGSDAPLFASVGNRSMEQRLTEPSIAAVIKDRFVSAGYDSHKLSAHSLRHSSITYLLKSGASIQEAQHHARHASPETTGIYAHNIKQEQEHFEQRVYDYIFGIEQDELNQAIDILKGLSKEKIKQVLPMLQAIAD